MGRNAWAGDGGAENKRQAEADLARENRERAEQDWGTKLRAKMAEARAGLTGSRLATFTAVFNALSCGGDRDTIPGILDATLGYLRTHEPVQSPGDVPAPGEVPPFTYVVSPTPENPLNISALIPGPPQSRGLSEPDAPTFEVDPNAPKIPATVREVVPPGYVPTSLGVSEEVCPVLGGPRPKKGRR